jgi:hypothetical protein
VRSASIKQHGVEYSDVRVLGDLYSKPQSLKTTHYNQPLVQMSITSKICEVKACETDKADRKCEYAELFTGRLFQRSMC